MFRFDFGDSNDTNSFQKNENEAQTIPSLLPAEKMNIDVLKTKAPRISYTKDKFSLPRRDLFDVKYELMSSENLSEEEKLLLGSEDVRKNVYEGGLKVWEGAYDLLEVLAKMKLEATSVMELGCGAGIPISFVFSEYVLSGRPGRFVFADYNPAVLQLLTMPNIILSWLAATGSEYVAADNNELNLDSTIIDSMLSDLQSKGIEIEFVSGAWSPQFSALVGSNFDLLLASETIYSLDSVGAFTDVVSRSLGNGLGLIAAKKIYFGVGGDIVQFEGLLDEKNMKHEVVLEKGSVGRVVLQVKHNK